MSHRKPTTAHSLSGWLLSLPAIVIMVTVADGLAAAGAPAVEQITPAQWLKRQVAPHFREGHTLPRLTRWGWTLPLDARVDLAERWGYALAFGGYATDQAVDRALNNLTSDEAKVLALTAGDPKKYPLCVILSRDLPSNPPAETWTRNAKGEYLGGRERVWSPEAPRAVLEEAAELRARPLRKLRAKVPVAMVLNGGEYALGVPGFAKKYWEQDPRIVAAKGNRGWYEYISEKKALMETIIAEAVRKAAPDRSLYIYYTAGGGTHRNRFAGWQDWGYGFEWMRSASDLPSDEYYYRHFNDGWTGDIDMLTTALNARGFELKLGAKFSYDWVSAGQVVESPRPQPANTNLAALVDPNADKAGDLRLYEGFLKCLYTAGTVGANAVYYAYPQGGFAKKFPADQPPHWLRQMVVLSRVHALFSYQDQFVRESDLLPGPNRHRWSKDQPAYEFPTGHAATRVLARKHARRAEWLITAWAADDVQRDVEIDVPELGKVQVRARAEGSVYQARLVDGKPQLRLLDSEDQPR